MNSSHFRPFHVYEVDTKFPNYQLLPFTYFLCLTNPLPAAHSVRHAIVGFPLIPGKPRKGFHDLRLPLKTGQSSDISLPGDYQVAVDSIGSYPYNLFRPQSQGEVSENEKRELKVLIRSFLSV